jgi:tetratricopeptide (TPR) repeat protein
MIRIAFLVCAAATLFAAPSLAQTALEQRCATGAGEGAVAACSDIIGIATGGPEIAWAYFDRARAYFGLKLYASAIDDLREDLKRKPDDAEALENRGFAYLAIDDYGRAIDDFGKVIDLRPASANAFRERCFARAATGRHLDDALKDCNQALKLGDRAALDARCLIGYRVGQYAAAIEDCSAALAANPKLASSLYLRALAKTKSGDAAGGEADRTAALSLDPSIADTFANYGVRP